MLSPLSVSQLGSGVVSVASSALGDSPRNSFINASTNASLVDPVNDSGDVQGRSFSWQYAILFCKGESVPPCGVPFG